MFRLMRSVLGPLLAASLLATSAGGSQSEPAKIQVGVDLVPLAVRVTDRHGNNVQGLDAKDFEILENSRPQKISFFSTGDQPVSMTILLDASSSMNSSGKLQPARAMLAQLVNRSHPQDEISLMPFTDQAGPVQLLTREQLSSPSIFQLAPQKGGTALYDAIAVALCRLRSSANLQQEVVVITDGADQHSRIGLESLIRLVQASRAQLFMVGFFSPSELQLYRSGDKSVILYTGREIDNPIVAFDRLAKESGAEAFFPTSQNALKQALEAIAGTLESQYLLAYYPQVESAGFRKIEVKVHRHGLVVRARRGVEMEPLVCGFAGPFPARPLRHLAGIPSLPLRVTPDPKSRLASLQRQLFRSSQRLAGSQRLQIHIRRIRTLVRQLAPKPPARRKDFFQFEPDWRGSAGRLRNMVAGFPSVRTCRRQLAETGRIESDITAFADDQRIFLRSRPCFSHE